MNDQTAQVNSFFSVQIPSSLFQSSTGGVLTISVSGLPSFLSYDPLTNQIKGTPRDTDQSFNGQTLFQIAISCKLAFPNSSVTATAITYLRVYLEGNSAFKDAFIYLGYSASIIGALSFLYLNRRYYYTNYKKNYPKYYYKATTEKPFSHAFNIHRDKIKKVQILFPRSIPYSCCNKIQRCLSENLERFNLPEENLIYDRVWNRVNSPALPPFHKISKVFFIRALGSGDITLEQIEVTVFEADTTNHSIGESRSSSIMHTAINKGSLNLLKTATSDKKSVSKSKNSSFFHFNRVSSSQLPAVQEEEYELTPNPVFYHASKESISQLSQDPYLSE